MGRESNDNNSLAHHGVPGMKWGHRTAGEKTSSGRTITKKDERWARKAERKLPLKAYNMAADKMNRTEIDRINSMPKFKNASVDKPGALRTAYFKEYSNTMTKALNDSASQLGLKSPSGALKVTFEFDAENDPFPRWGVEEA